MARRILAEPKTALAGVMLEISVARLRVSMATSNAERTPSRPFDCFGLVPVAIIETCGGCGERCSAKAVWINPCPNRDAQRSFS